ncbi:zinc finger CCCH domain-containing protein 18, partial [Biomphalaria pfeifferi]
MSDWTNLVSALLHIVGYTLFWFGVTSSEWRSEIGYSYGLWARCDDTGCISLIYENTAGYLLLVQCGIAGSFVLLTVSVVGVAVGELIRLCKVKQRHATRANYVICISAASG